MGQISSSASLGLGNRAMGLDGHLDDLRDAEDEGARIVEAPGDVGHLEAAAGCESSIVDLDVERNRNLVPLAENLQMKSLSLSR